MKLSDVKGERTIDVVAEIFGPVMRIAADEDAANLFKPKKAPKGMTDRQFAMQRAEKSVPALMRNHKDELITIMCVLEGVSRDEYLASLNLVKLGKDVFELVTDEEFQSFF